MKRIFPIFMALVIMLATTLACGAIGTPPTAKPGCPVADLRIVAGPEIQLLESQGIFAGFTESTKTADCPSGIPVTVSYAGAVDMKVMISAYASNNPGDVDFWWAPSPIWTPGGYVQGQTSIMRTVTVFAMDPSLADSLGWNTKTTHTMSDVLDGIRSGAIKLAMPSASQDDAGAMAYLAALSALKGGPQTLRLEDLSDPTIVENVMTLFSAVNASASRSDVLRVRFVADRTSASPQFNSLFISESMALAVNRDLVAANATPMHIYYLSDATGLSKYPLGYDKKASDEVKVEFAAFVAYLKSQIVQDKLLALGFRTGDIGLRLDAANPVVNQVFNPAWGVITNYDFPLIELPKDPVIDAALTLYQTQFRRASFTVYCLDYSPSMDGSGHDQLMEAMKFILNQSTASQYLLQAGPQDVTYTLPFAGTVLNEFSVVGNDPKAFYGETGDSNNPYTPDSLMGKLYSQPSEGSTSIYGCANRALQIISQNASIDQLPSLILMTDGVHNTSPNYEDMAATYQSLGRPVPIYSIQFGDADRAELDRMAQLTNGQVCDGRGGQDKFIACFKLFKGNN